MSSYITIVLDMDGTIADLNNVPCWIERLNIEDETAYSSAKPLVDMKKLAYNIDKFRKYGGRVVINTHCAIDSSARFSRKTKRAKQEWLRHYGINYDKMICSKYGSSKHRNSNSYINILIDDNENVREEFVNHSTHNWAVDPNGTDIVDFINKCAGVMLMRNIYTS